MSMFRSSIFVTQYSCCWRFQRTWARMQGFKVHSLSFARTRIPVSLIAAIVWRSWAEASSMVPLVNPPVDKKASPDVKATVKVKMQTAILRKVRPGVSWS